MAGRRTRKIARIYRTRAFSFAVVFLTIVVCVVFRLLDIDRGDGNGTAKGDLPKTSAAQTASVTETAASAVTTAPSVTENAVTTNEGVPMSQAVSEDYLKSCAFVGDSITVGLSSYQFLPAMNVIAEVGINVSSINDEPIQTAYGTLTVLEALEDAKPENVYVMLGSNGIAWLGIDSMIESYSEFVESVRSALPESDIYIVSIPPVADFKEKSEQPIFNSFIDEYNKCLLDYAVRNNFYYVDLNAELKDGSGALSSEDAADDGVHFNRSTYEKMVNFILTHVA